MSDEKTEKPTDQKLRKAREEGQVSRSSDLTDAFSMAAAIVALMATGVQIQQALRSMMGVMLDFAAGDHSVWAMQRALVALLGAAALIVLPCLMAAVFGALLASIAQVGFQIATKPVTPDPQAVNPMTGLKRIFSSRTLIECLKMVIKSLVTGIVMWQTIKALLPLMVGALYQPLPSLADLLWQILLKLLFVSVLAFIVIGAADAKIQKAMFLRQQKMSKDEIKREHKEQDGDPLIKRERKKLARQLTEPTEGGKVGLANVVLTNPTHYAVGVRYAPDEHPLPRVICKGADELAAHIREVARSLHVPLISIPPVARALFQVEENAPVPEELFETIAALLRWVDALASSHATPALDGAHAADGEASVPDAPPGTLPGNGEVWGLRI